MENKFNPQEAAIALAIYLQELCDAKQLPTTEPEGEDYGQNWLMEFYEKFPDRTQDFAATLEAILQNHPYTLQLFELVFNIRLAAELGNALENAREYLSSVETE